MGKENKIKSKENQEKLYWNLGRQILALGEDPMTVLNCKTPEETNAAKAIVNKFVESLYPLGKPQDERYKPKTVRIYMVQLHKLVETAQDSQYFHNKAILNFIERERKGAESVDKRRMNADKYDRTVSTKVEDLIANYNTNEHSAELAQQLITSPETFSKGDHKVVDLLLTVLIFENYTRPCALYNMTMEELEKAAPSKTLGKLCILVQELKNPQDHGLQPINVRSAIHCGLVNYVKHVLPGPADDSKHLVLLNSKGKSLEGTVNTRVKRHLREVGLSDTVVAGVTFKCTAVRTMITTIACEKDQEEGTSVYAATSRNQLLRSEPVQMRSYKANQAVEKIMKGHEVLGNLANFGSDPFTRVLIQSKDPSTQVDNQHAGPSTEVPDNHAPTTNCSNACVYNFELKLFLWVFLSP